MSAFVKDYLLNYFSKRDLYSKLVTHSDRQLNKNDYISKIINKNDILNENLIYHEMIENNYEILRSSYTKAEEALMSSHIDISFSGTTSVIIIIMSKKLFISVMKLICVNVGDSRAIMISSKKISV